MSRATREGLGEKSHEVGWHQFLGGGNTEPSSSYGCQNKFAIGSRCYLAPECIPFLLENGHIFNTSQYIEEKHIMRLNGTLLE